MSNSYDDIIHLPRHVSLTRMPMARENRAAQFSPFAALTGYDAAIQETARRTEKRLELSEDAMADLDRKLRTLAGNIEQHPQVVVTYFQADAKKEGGAYVTAAGALKKIDNYAGVLVLMDGSRVAIRDILEIESDMLKLL